MLEVKDLSVSYADIEVIKRISLDIKYKEIVTIIGSNGAGKTTILRTISGIIKPNKSGIGEIKFEEKDIAKLTPDRIVQLGIIHVPEGRMILRNLTVLENLLIGACCRRDKQQIKSDVERMFGLFPILRIRKSNLGSALSGGEQQMLAIARGLMAIPKLLLIDEPSLGLAPLIIQEVFTLIARLRDEGVTICLVEQNAKQAFKFSDRGYVIQNGRIVFEDSTKNLMDNMDIISSYLG